MTSTSKYINPGFYIIKMIKLTFADVDAKRFFMELATHDFLKAKFHHEDETCNNSKK